MAKEVVVTGKEKLAITIYGNMEILKNINTQEKCLRANAL